jgi:hypothetical protein
MSEGDLPDKGTTWLSQLQRIEAACARFGAAWEAGQHPAIEAALAEVPPADRATLLRELLTLELDYRGRTGEAPTLEEYQARFAEYAELVAVVFREHTAPPAPPPGGPSVPAEGVEPVDGEDTQSPAVPAPSAGPADRPDLVADTLEEGPGEGGGAPDDDPRRQAYTFLSPPQGPDELGRLGTYRVLEALGSGGMGTVFKAEDPHLRRFVALKVMKPALAADEKARELVLREARAAAALEHDHVIPIHQVGEERGLPFLTMPLLKGETLRDRLKRAGRPPLDEVLRIGREVAEGLAAAHRHGMTHRDIKPANIWLETREGKPGGPSPGYRVRLLDFGLARLAGDGPHLTPSGAVLGTPAYMAPEQVRSARAADARSDLFSLGCVLYQLCTGRRPFDGPTALAVLRAVTRHQPPAPREVHADLPPALSDLVMKLLAKEPSRRCQSAGEVVEALTALERGGAAPGRPAGAPAPPRRRRPPVVAAAAALCAILGVALAGAVILITTGKGQLVIETDDPTVEVVVKRDGATIIDHTARRQLDLKVGDYEIDLAEAKEGLRLSTKKFTITRNGTTAVKVTLGNAPGEARDDAHQCPRHEIGPGAGGHVPDGIARRRGRAGPSRGAPACRPHHPAVLPRRSRGDGRPVPGLRPGVGLPHRRREAGHGLLPPPPQPQLSGGGRLHLAAPGLGPGGRLPRRVRELERRRGVLPVAEPEGGEDLPAADGGGVGVRVPGRQGHAVQPRRAAVVAAGEHQRHPARWRGGGRAVPGAAGGGRLVRGQRLRRV